MIPRWAALISKTNPHCEISRGSAQVSAGQCGEKQLVPVVLSQCTSPDDTADRGEQREAHTRHKHKPRGQLCGKHQGEETEISRKSREWHRTQE